MITLPPLGKVGAYLNTFDVGLCVPLTGIQKGLIHRNICSVQMLTHSTVHKMVACKMIPRPSGEALTEDMVDSKDEIITSVGHVA